ncbi:MAG TPA: hypothetical protein VGR48_12330 [Terriglobales bacterium]|nr:hypothetical protein [Terriglobales bacterium]
MGKMVGNRGVRSGPKFENRLPGPTSSVDEHTEFPQLYPPNEKRVGWGTPFRLWDILARLREERWATRPNLAGLGATYEINGVQVSETAFNGFVLGQGGAGLEFAFDPGSGIGAASKNNIAAEGDWTFGEIGSLQILAGVLPVVDEYFFVDTAVYGYMLNPAGSASVTVSSATDSPVTTLNNRVNELGQALNRTGVQTLQNPCLYAGWTAAAGVVGGVGVAVANGQATAAAANNYPTLIHRALSWLYDFGSAPGKPGLVNAAVATAVNGWHAAGGVCNQF